MSSTSHLTVASTSETEIDKRQSNFNSRTIYREGLSNCIHLSTSPSTNPKYLYYVNAEPTRKPSAIATTLATPTTSNARQRLTSISLLVPWNKRARSPTDDQLSPKPHKMSRDRLLPLDKLFNSSGSPTITDDDQPSTINDLTPLDESIKLNEKNMQQIKENGYLNNSSHLMTR